MLIPLKRKYRTNSKPKKSAKPGNGHSGKRKFAKGKYRETPNLPGVRTMIVLPNGKTRMVWR